MAETAKITWDDSITQGVTNHKIYRDDVSIGIVGLAVGVFYDTNTVAGATYKYEVQAIDSVGESIEEVLDTNVFYISIPQVVEPPVDGLTPIMTNFRVEDATPTLVHFDTPLGSVSGISATDFEIYGKTISSVSANYFTLDAPLTHWDNNTIRKTGTDTTVYNFDLQHITNNIAEPSTSLVRYGSRLGSGTQDGLSEANAWSWAEVQTEAANDMLVWVKAGGDFSSSTFSSNLAIGTPCIIKGYKTTIGDLDGVKFYTHVEGGTFDNTEAPTIVGGSNGIYAAGDNYIFKNFQAQDGTSRNFYTQDAQNIIFDNCASMDSGQAGLRSYRTDNVRFTNITSVNEDESALHLWDSNNSLIKDCLVITDGTFTGGDYYYQVHGSNNILTGLTANRNTLTSHSGHGISIKGSGVVTEYNLVEDCQLTSINMPIEARHGEVKNNVYRNIEHNNLIATAGNGGSLMIMNGPSFNTFDNVRLKDGWAGIRVTSTTESSTNTTMGHDNIFKNCIFNNQLNGFLIPEDTSASGNYEFYNNQIINCSFIRTGSSQDFFSITSDDIRDNTIQNSIINGYGTEGTSAGFAFTYSNFYNAFTTPSGTGNINDNPTFEDTVDFRPTNDALISAVKLVDYDAFGNERADITTMGYFIDVDEVIEEPPSDFRIISYEILSVTATTAEVRATMTENCSINYYVDTVKNAASSDDFNAFEVAPNEWRHTRTLTGLTPGTTANLIIEVTAQDDLEVVQSGNIPLTTTGEAVVPTITVSNTDGTADFSTVQAAINSGLVAGDIVGLKGGDEFQEVLALNLLSGADGNPITFTSYATGQAIITAIATQSHTWISKGSNIWYTTEYSDDPKRLLLDGTELQPSVSYAELGTDYSSTGTPNIASFWSGDAGDGGSYLYMYLGDSPENHIVKYTTAAYAFDLKNCNYITIDNIDIQGGRGAALAFRGANNIKVINSSLGAYAWLAIQNGYQATGGNPSNNLIDNCMIDSVFNLDYKGSGNTTNTTNFGGEDALSLTTCINTTISNNTFYDWTHVSINLTGGATAVYGNIVYGNHFELRGNLDYGGSITIDSNANNNEIYNNTLTRVKRSQMSGYENNIHDNTFTGCIDSVLKVGISVGQGIDIQGYSAGGRCDTNTIHNNTFIDCDGAGINVDGNNSASENYGHIITNNTITNCGLDVYTDNVGLSVEPKINTYDTRDLTITGNNIYSPATTLTCDYYGTDMTVATFNTQTSNNNTINSNTSNIT